MTCWLKTLFSCFWKLCPPQEESMTCISLRSHSLGGGAGRKVAPGGELAHDGEVVQGGEVALEPCTFQPELLPAFSSLPGKQPSPMPSQRPSHCHRNRQSKSQAPRQHLTCRRKILLFFFKKSIYFLSKSQYPRKSSEF